MSTEAGITIAFFAMMSAGMLCMLPIPIGLKRIIVRSTDRNLMETLAARVEQHEDFESAGYSKGALRYVYVGSDRFVTTDEGSRQEKHQVWATAQVSPDGAGIEVTIRARLIVFASAAFLVLFTAAWGAQAVRGMIIDWPTYARWQAAVSIIIATGGVVGLLAMAILVTRRVRRELASHVEFIEDLARSTPQT